MHHNLHQLGFVWLYTPLGEITAFHMTPSWFQGRWRKERVGRGVGKKRQEKRGFCAERGRIGLGTT